MAQKYLHDRHALVQLAPPGKIKPAADDEDSDSGGDDEDDDSDSNSDAKKRRLCVRVLGAQNLSTEGDSVLLYHAHSNTRVYHEADPAGIEFGFGDAYALETLLQATSEKPILYRDVPADTEEDRKRIVDHLLAQKVNGVAMIYYTYSYVKNMI